MISAVVGEPSRLINRHRARSAMLLRIEVAVYKFRIARIAPSHAARRVLPPTQLAIPVEMTTAVARRVAPPSLPQGLERLLQAVTRWYRTSRPIPFVAVLMRGSSLARRLNSEHPLAAISNRTRGLGYATHLPVRRNNAVVTQIDPAVSIEVGDSVAPFPHPITVTCGKDVPILRVHAAIFGDVTAD